ncbi:helix-turn-helix transcriptional regulator [Sphingomonas sanguinis]|uniref:helix-turn-helix transcriptional regulator n=1 Tax=Sphingomonas sanguinis TaxID=33051 RepID=UPI003A0FE4F0
MNTQILRRPAVEKMVGLSRSSIYAAMDRDLFPRPIQLGPRAVGWRMSDLESWIESREMAIPSNKGW